jgi:hypothetical protein
MQKAMNRTGIRAAFARQPAQRIQGRAAQENQSRALTPQSGVE